jgi:tetratricopeptide (TPR) repeat protein
MFAPSSTYQSSVVHRDLKPSNILGTDDGQAKLLTSIAKLMDERLMGPVETVTRTEFRALTPEYAAPEQVRGEPVTTATDVYALGAVLYEMLTGRRPYQIARRTAAEIEQVAKARVVKDFLVDLFQVADPAESRGREITAENLLARGVYGPRHPEYASRLKDRGVVLKDLGDLPDAESLLTRALTIQRDALGPKTVEVAETMGELANVVSDAGQYARAESLYRGTLAIDVKRYGPRHLRVAEDLSNLMVLYGGDDMGQHDRSDSAGRAALAIRLQLLDPEHPAVLTNIGDLAVNLADAGRYAEAESLEREVLAGYRRLHPNGHTDVGWALHSVGRPDPGGAFPGPGAEAPLEALVQPLPTRSFHRRLHRRVVARVGGHRLAVL